LTSRSGMASEGRSFKDSLLLASPSLADTLRDLVFGARKGRYRLKNADLKTEVAGVFNPG